MAKKKNQELIGYVMYLVILIVMGVGLVLYYSLAVAVALLPIVLPPILLVAGMIYWHIYKKRDIPIIQNKFQLSKEDIDTLGVQLAKIKIAENKVAEIKENIQLGRVRVNKDGSINRKQSGGYAVEGALNQAQQTIDIVTPQYHELMKKQEKIYKTAKKHFAKYWAYLISVIIFVLSLLILCEGKVISTYKEYFNIVQTTVNESSTNSVDLPLFDATVLMLVVLILVIIVCRIIFAIKYRKTYKQSVDERMNAVARIAALLIKQNS